MEYYVMHESEKFSLDRYVVFVDPSGENIILDGRLAFEVIKRYAAELNSGTPNIVRPKTTGETSAGYTID